MFCMRMKAVEGGDCDSPLPRKCKIRKAQVLGIILVPLLYATCLQHNAFAQLAVGPAGTRTIDFSTQPTRAAGWSTLTIMPNADAAIATGVQLDDAVATNNASQVNLELGRSATLPPSANAVARWNNNSNGYFIQSRPTGNSYTLLMCTLSNTTGSTVGAVKIAYDLGALVSSGSTISEDIYGFRAYWSLTGEAGSWRVIPELCDGAVGHLAAIIAVGGWAPHSLLYILWADDNGPAVDLAPLKEGAYTIDNLRVTPLQSYTRGGGSIAIQPPQSPAEINATVTLTAVPAAGFVFLGWLGDVEGSNAVVGVTMGRSQYVEAVFGTTLGTTVLGNGSVTMEPPGGVYPYGQEVRLWALPQSGAYFRSWLNPLVSANDSITVLVTNPNESVSASFESLGAGQWALTIGASGAGRVQVSPLGNVFTNGQSVTLTAIPDAEQSFLGWSGDATGLQNPMTITMDQNRSLVAQFTRRPSLELGPGYGFWGEGGFRARLHGELGAIYCIESSSDFANWSPLTVVTNVLGSVQFTAGSNTNLAPRFYRARLEP